MQRLSPGQLIMTGVIASAISGVFTPIGKKLSNMAGQQIQSTRWYKYAQGTVVGEQTGKQIKANWRQTEQFTGQQLKQYRYYTTGASTIGEMDAYSLSNVIGFAVSNRARMPISSVSQLNYAKQLDKDLGQRLADKQVSYNEAYLQFLNRTKQANKMVKASDQLASMYGFVRENKKLATKYGPAQMAQYTIQLTSLNPMQKFTFGGFALQMTQSVGVSSLTKYQFQNVPKLGQQIEKIQGTFGKQPKWQLSFDEFNTILSHPTQQIGQQTTAFGKNVQYISRSIYDMTLNLINKEDASTQTRRIRRQFKELLNVNKIARTMYNAQQSEQLEDQLGVKHIQNFVYEFMSDQQLDPTELIDMGIQRSVTNMRTEMNTAATQRAEQSGKSIIAEQRYYILDKILSDKNSKITKSFVEELNARLKNLQSKSELLEKNGFREVAFEDFINGTVKYSDFNLSLENQDIENERFVEVLTRLKAQGFDTSANIGSGVYMKNGMITSKPQQELQWLRTQSQMAKTIKIPFLGFNPISLFQPDLQLYLKDSDITQFISQESYVPTKKGTMQVMDIVRNQIVENEYSNEQLHTLFNRDERSTETMQQIARYLNNEPTDENIRDVANTFQLLYQSDDQNVNTSDLIFRHLRETTTQQQSLDTEQQQIDRVVSGLRTIVNGQLGLNLSEEFRPQNNINFVHQLANLNVPRFREMEQQLQYDITNSVMYIVGKSSFVIGSHGMYDISDLIPESYIVPKFRVSGSVFRQYQQQIGTIFPKTAVQYNQETNTIEDVNVGQIPTAQFKNIPFFNHFNIDRTMYKQNYDYLAQPFTYKKIRTEIEQKLIDEQPTDTILQMAKTQIGIPSQEREEQILQAINQMAGNITDQSTIEEILSPTSQIMKEQYAEFQDYINTYYYTQSLQETTAKQAQQLGNQQLQAQQDEYAKMQKLLQPSPLENMQYQTMKQSVSKTGEQILSKEQTTAGIDMRQVVLYSQQLSQKLKETYSEELMGLLADTRLLVSNTPLSLAETSTFFNYFLHGIYDFGTKESQQQLRQIYDEQFADILGQIDENGQLLNSMQFQYLKQKAIKQNSMTILSQANNAIAPGRSISTLQQHLNIREQTHSIMNFISGQTPEYMFTEEQIDTQLQPIMSSSFLWQRYKEVLGLAPTTIGSPQVDLNKLMQQYTFQDVEDMEDNYVSLQMQNKYILFPRFRAPSELQSDEQPQFQRYIRQLLPHTIFEPNPIKQWEMTHKLYSPTGYNDYYIRDQQLREQYQREQAQYVTPESTLLQFIAQRPSQLYEELGLGRPNPFESTDQLGELSAQLSKQQFIALGVSQFQLVEQPLYDQTNGKVSLKKQGVEQAKDVTTGGIGLLNQIGIGPLGRFLGDQYTGLVPLTAFSYGFVAGGERSQVLAQSIGMLTQFIPHTKEYVLQVEGIKDEPVYKSQLWEFGREPYYGGQVKEYRPSLLYLEGEDWQYTPIGLGSKTEQLIHQKPSFFNFFGMFLQNDFHYDKKLQLYRPYAIKQGRPDFYTVPYGLVPNNINLAQIQLQELTGGTLNKFKPLDIYQEQLQDLAHGQAMQRQTSMSKTQQVKYINTIDERNALDVGSYITQYQTLGTGNWLRSFNGTRAQAGPFARSPEYKSNEQIASYLKTQYNQEGTSAFESLGYWQQNYLGMFGFMVGTTLQGMQDQSESISKLRLQSSEYWYSSERSYYQQRLGSMFGTTELYRRFNQNIRFKDLKINPLPNPYMISNFPWLPNRFLVGDPYQQISYGEVRLPGPGYEKVRGSVDDYGIVDMFRILSNVQPRDRTTKNQQKYAREYRDTGQATLQERYLIQQGLEEIDAQQSQPIEDYWQNMKLKKQRVNIQKYLGNQQFETSTGEIVRIQGISTDVDEVAKKIYEQQSVGLDEQYSMARKKIQETEQHFKNLEGSNITLYVPKDINQKYTYVDKDTMYMNAIMKDYKPDKELLKTDTQLQKRYQYGTSIGKQITESIAHSYGYVYEKFSQQNSAYEELKRYYVQGQYRQLWQNPVSDFIMPMIRNRMTESPLDVINSSVLSQLLSQNTFSQKQQTMAADFAFNGIGGLFYTQSNIPSDIEKYYDIETQGQVLKSLTSTETILNKQAENKLMSLNWYKSKFSQPRRWVLESFEQQSTKDLKRGVEIMDPLMQDILSNVYRQKEQHENLQDYSEFKIDRIEEQQYDQLENLPKPVLDQQGIVDIDQYKTFQIMRDIGDLPQYSLYPTQMQKQTFTLYQTEQNREYDYMNSNTTFVYNQVMQNEILAAYHNSQK